MPQSGPATLHGDKAPRNVAENHTLSKEFNSADADVTFRSMDRVVFKIHSTYLNVNTEGFATPVGTKISQVVELTESSDTLTLLFRFIYPARHPDLEDLDFQRLQLLATAAEKYRVFAAMNTCKIHMKHALPQHPEDVLFYSMQHGYRDIMDVAAPQVVHVPLKDLSSRMPVQCLKSWIQYHDCWLQTLKRALRYHLRGHTDDHIQNLPLCHKFPALTLRPSSSSSDRSTLVSAVDPSSDESTDEEATTTSIDSSVASQGSTFPKFWASTPSTTPFSPSTSVRFASPAPPAFPSNIPIFPPPARPSPFIAFISDPDPINHWCAEGSRKIIDVLGKMNGDIGALQNLNGIFGTQVTCFTCRATMHSWRNAIEADVCLIPSLSTLL